MAPRSIPQYRQISIALDQQIKSSGMSPGDSLPNEAELSRMFGVSKMTMRQALGLLAARGVIERHHGRGTIVASPKLQRQLQHPLGLADELASRGVRAGSRIVELEQMRPPPDVRRRLWLGPRARVHRILRLRYADDLLLGLQETFVPVPYAPGLQDIDLTDRSLTHILRDEYGIVEKSIELTIEAVGADHRTSALVGVPIGSPMLQATRVSFQANGRPVEQSRGWFHPERYSYLIRDGVDDASASSGNANIHSITGPAAPSA